VAAAEGGARGHVRPDEQQGQAEVAQHRLGDAAEQGLRTSPPVGAHAHQRARLDALGDGQHRRLAVHERGLEVGPVGAAVGELCQVRGRALLVARVGLAQGRDGEPGAPGEVERRAQGPFGVR